MKVDKNAPLKCLRMTWNSQFHPIHNVSNLFPLRWLRITQNGQFHPIHNFSNLFPLKWLRMTRNGQFYPIHNFSNLFPLTKWLRMTQNGQFCMAIKKKKNTTREFLRKITLLHGQLCHKPYGFLVSTFYETEQDYGHV